MLNIKIKIKKLMYYLGFLFVVLKNRNGNNSLNLPLNNWGFKKKLAS